MEGSLLAGRSLARDLSGDHRWVELAAQDRCRLQKASGSREDERVVRRPAELAPPLAEQVDDVLGQVQVAALVVLRRTDVAVRDATADVDHRVGGVEAAPLEREQLASVSPSSLLAQPRRWPRSPSARRRVSSNAAECPFRYTSRLDWPFE
jgi:hypothetical protein